jgi:hypothetical protein
MHGSLDTAVKHVQVLVNAREFRAGCGPVNGRGCGCASNRGSAKCNAEHDGKYRAFDLHDSSEDDDEQGYGIGDRRAGVPWQAMVAQAGIGRLACSPHHPNGGSRPAHPLARPDRRSESFR